ncbi:hypothetical protein [Nitrospira moscoviensis]|uniref:Uncharacterized protein n=1 Tax=Nitrospira moscoviensis TaxID=42253 RepID=A0A0K2GH54_NITMO|nr:hypothetical protein [Nitrospira moscoviensis]ALA60184.1 hypothetical protein NITMOv2_3794 [Nitrospira moscoviensis]
MFAYGNDRMELTPEEVIVRWWEHECPPALRAAILRRADEDDSTWWDIVHDSLLAFTERLNTDPALQSEFKAFVRRIESPLGLDPRVQSSR